MEYKEFEKMMKSARNAYIRADVKMRELFTTIESEFPDSKLDELKTSSENADSIEDAICCYLQYGESSPEKIWDDILLGQLD